MKNSSNLEVKLHSEYIHTFTFTQEDVLNFAKLTGDNNPIHLDENYARNTVFKRLIMHGFLGASVFSKVFGTIFPGEGSIYLKQDLIFLAPMYVNDQYHAIFTVSDVNDAKARATISTIIRDKSQKVVLKGEALIQNPIFQKKE